MEFYNRYLFYNNRFLSVKVNQEVRNYRKKRYSKKLLSLIKVDGLDLEKLYSVFVKRQKLRDENSCYARDWLVYNN